MTNKPLVSFVMPVYNAEPFLQESLKSISAQTFKDWELIVIDDGSTDKSGNILENHAADDNRIRLVRHENKGLVRTLNEGISMACGKWIARMDADDICLPDRLEKQLGWAIEQNAQVCGGGIERLGVAGKHSWIFPTSCEGIYAWLLFRPAFAHPTVIMYRETALKFPYSEEFSCAQDYELWTRMALNQVKMTNYPGTVLQYRIHEQQISHARKQQQTDMRMEITRRYWQKSGFSRDLLFTPSVFDESITPSKEDFLLAAKVFKRIAGRMTDNQAAAALLHHQIWFIYRSVDLGFHTVAPKLRGMKISGAKKLAIALLSIFHAGRVIGYFRNAGWIRNLPLNWFF